MMKRKIIVGIATLALGALLVPAAFAAVDNSANDAANVNNQQFFNQMFDQHKPWLDKAVKDGQITGEQAETWNQHFDQMKEFHDKNGMGPMSDMMNGMMGPNSGMMGGPNGSGMMGNGAGMMGNFGAQVNK